MAFDPDWVLRTLDEEHEEVPVEALRAAQAHRDVMIPRLIQVIEEATAAAVRDEAPTQNVQFYAIKLLIEFKAFESWPAIQSALRLKSDAQEKVLGSPCEWIAQYMGIAFDGRPDELGRVIEDPTIEGIVRSSMARAYLYEIQDGRLTRKDVADRLLKHLDWAVAHNDRELAAFLVCDLIDVAHPESRAKIEAAFETGAIDTSIVDLDSVEIALSDPNKSFASTMERVGPRGIDDTVESVSQWYAFNRSIHPTPSANVETGTHDQPFATMPDSLDWPPQASAVIRDDTPKVGRNDPCPCRSGKKYKKCCANG